jgi:hypothetical protein
MSINFNLWFIDTAAHSGGMSTYRQQVDFLLHTAGEVLTPAQAAARVASLRTAGVSHTDTVGSGAPCTPPTGSPTAGPTGSPTGSPTASPTASPTPTGPPPNCSTAPLWNIGSVYTAGNRVKWERSANGNPNGPKSGDGVHLWRARWWTQGSEPGWTVQWEDLGRC